MKRSASGGISVSISESGGLTVQLRDIPAEQLAPNPWNPNKMDKGMLAKERASIQEFGFVDPLTVRTIGAGLWEIIDGEHRWRVGMDLGMVVFPCVDLGTIDPDVARQLTIVLNETRGQADPQRLAELVRDLSTRIDIPRLADVLPFSAERLADMSGIRQQMQDRFEQAQAQQSSGKGRMVERIYRLPTDVAEALDDAIEKARVEGAQSDAEALGVIARDFTGA